MEGCIWEEVHLRVHSSPCKSLKGVEGHHWHFQLGIQYYKLLNVLEMQLNIERPAVINLKD